MSRVLPILFNTDMVQAILDGRKTVMRRVIKPTQLIRLGWSRCPNNFPEEYIKEKMFLFKPWCDMEDRELINAIYKPPYRPGDILYVRETWGTYARNWWEADYFMYRSDYPNGATTYLYGDGIVCDLPKWRPSIHMPKEAARIFLRVTSVRVERLRDIDENGAKAEGVRSYWSQPHDNDVPFIGIGRESDCLFDTRVEAFSQIWNSTIKKTDLDRYGWDVSPWVWVIEFERCEKPESEGT